MSGHLEALPLDAQGYSLPAHELMAIRVNTHFSYDDQATYVPSALKGNVPKNLKIHDNFEIPVGEECYKVILPNPDKNWAMIVVCRKNVSVYAVIPHTYYDIGTPEPGATEPGKYFRGLDEKLSRNESGFQRVTTYQTTTSSVATPSGFFHQWMIEFWRLVVANIQDLKQVGLHPSMVDAICSNTHRAVLQADVMRGLPAEVKIVLDKCSNMTYKDLRDLPHIVLGYPAPGAGIYMRLYTHADRHRQDIDTTAIYVGQSIDLQDRQRAHNRNTPSDHVPNSTPLHYTIVSRIPEEHRHAILLCFWPSAAVGQLQPESMAFAEQTLMSYLQAFNYSMTLGSVDNPATDTPVKSQGIVMMRLALQAFDNLGRGATPRHKGCNLSAPIFERRGVNLIKRVCLRPFADRGRNVYRMACYISQFGSPTRRRLVVFLWAKDGLRQYGFTFDTHGNIHNVPAKTFGYLVFEIMTDGKPHDTPFVGCPSIGPFANFGVASSLAVRLEYTLDDTEWFSLPAQHRYTYWSEAVAANSQAMAIQYWVRAMEIIQALEGVVFSGPLNNTFATRVSFRAMKVVHLEVNHLEQIARWVPRKEVSLQAPRKVDMNYNFLEMWRTYDLPMMIIGFRPDEELHPIQNTDRRYWRGVAGRQRPMMCDLCLISAKGSEELTCDAVDSGLASCSRCVLLDRPCSFTPLTILREHYGSTPPFPTRLPHLEISLYTNSPFKSYTFYRNLTPEVLQTPVPVPAPHRDYQAQEVIMAEAGGELGGED